MIDYICQWVHVLMITCLDDYMSWWLYVIEAVDMIDAIDMIEVIDLLMITCVDDYIGWWLHRFDRLHILIELN